MTIIHSDYIYKELEGAKTIKEDDPILVEYFRALDERLIPEMDKIQSQKDIGELKAGEYLLQ